MEKVNFTDPDTNESAEFYVLEQTTIRGINYLLVTVDEEGDSDAFILKETQNEDDHNTIYEMVEDDIGFPVKMAQQSYQYLQERVAEQKKRLQSRHRS